MDQQSTRTVLKLSIVFIFAAAMVLTSSRLHEPVISAPVQETPAFDQAAELAKLRAAIKGKENEPAEKVFKNIQSLKGFPAGRLLAIMEVGFSRSLGVSCTHCHVPGKWESDERTPKQTAREMWAMTATINQQLLKNISTLKSGTPMVNCTTCHRGQTKPALNLPAAKPT